MLAPTLSKTAGAIAPTAPILTRVLIFRKVVIIQPIELQMVQAVYQMKDVNFINILIGSVFQSDFDKN